MSKKILIIEDDKDIVELVRHYLEKENFVLKDAADGFSGLKKAKSENFDLVILDIMLPEMDGLEVCKELRADSKTSSTPVVMLTAKGEETDKIVGLEIGADDYLTKPFSPRELVARVKALLRRVEKKPEKEKIYRYANLVLDLFKHEVTLDRKVFQLTSKEFALLECLLRNKGRVLSRDYLMDQVWGYDYYGGMRTVDVHIRRLREKIPLLSQSIQTVKNLGYRLKEISPE
ncbi:MAG: DNA-binding response regulator [candidate division Zixibacteria bacterium RBG_16_43_9]|nr:MAG: DNA-binding response regulator [candidate division Zixibacteria bacterium RBG_16_43_9]